MASIRLEQVVKRFGPVVAVNHIDLEVKNKEFIVLLGPSGCGKTTTLRCIAGLETPETGNIYIDDVLVNELSAADRDIAFVFQFYALYPHLTSYENIAFPLQAQRISGHEVDSSVKKVAKLLRIEHILDKRPKVLSGGEMQRVALGRAMVRQPKAFLMDEPLGTLDAKLREEMRAELKRLCVDIGGTIIYVTHDQVEAMSMGDRIVVMNRGAIQQMGTPKEVYDNPANLFVANFIGSPGMSFLNCNFTFVKNQSIFFQIGSGRISFEISPKFHKVLQGGSFEEQLILGIRSEDVHIQKKKGPDLIETEVYAVESLGSKNIINLKIDGHILKARALPTFTARMGEKIWVSFDQQRLHLFNKRTEKAIV